MADKRIYELTEASTVGSSDVLALDSQNMAATKKVKVKTITDPLSNKNDISSLILTGSTNTTGGTIEAGRYFYLDGDLVIAKTNIAAGATFTPGTNYVLATVGGELTDVKQTLSTKLNKNNITPSNHILSTNVAAANYQPNELISYADSLFYTTKKVNSGETISGSTNVSQTTFNSIMAKRHSFLEGWESNGTTTLTIPIGEKLVFLFGGRRNKCFAIILLPNGEHSIMFNENDIINTLTWTVTDSVGTLTFTWNSVYGTSFMANMFT